MYRADIWGYPWVVSGEPPTDCTLQKNTRAVYSAPSGLRSLAILRQILDADLVQRLRGLRTDARVAHVRQNDVGQRVGCDGLEKECVCGLILLRRPDEFVSILCTQDFGGYLYASVRECYAQKTLSLKAFR